LKCKKLNCNANALKSDDFCFFHSQKPEIITKRKLSQSKGGSKSKRNKKPISIESLTDIQVILLETLNEMRSSGADNVVSRSRAITYICSKLADIREQVDLEKRIEALEKRLHNGYLI
jgi:hypothetical protein